MKATLFAAAAAAALLAGCEARFTDEGEEGDAAVNVSAEGKAEEGQLSINAPGFEFKMRIPEGIRSRADIDSDDGIIYPNSEFSGIHIQGGRDRAGADSDGEVELRFTTGDAPDAVARWYQDAGRNADFQVATSDRDGDAFVIAGTTRDDGGNFRVRIAPAAGGGSEGRMVLSDRR